MLHVLQGPRVTASDIEDEVPPKPGPTDTCRTLDLQVEGAEVIRLEPGRSWRISATVAEDYSYLQWEGMSCQNPVTGAGVVAASSHERNGSYELLCSGPGAAELSIGLDHGLLTPTRSTAAEVVVCRTP